MSTGPRRRHRWLGISALVLAALLTPAGAVVGVDVVADPPCTVAKPVLYSAPLTAPRIHLSGNPFGVTLTRDSRWMFVSLQAFSTGDPNGVAVFRRQDATTLLNEGFVSLHPGVGGLTLSADEGLLFIADGDGVAVVDVRRVTTGGAGTLLGYLSTGAGAGTFEVAVAGDRYLFSADESSGRLTMFDLARVRAGDLAHARLRSISLGLATTDVTVGPSGRYLYAVSQLQRPPVSLGPTDLIYGSIASVGLVNRAGLLDVIDIERWAAGAGRPVVAEVFAGCSPVRVIADAAEQNLWVSARGSNEVIGFDRDRLLHGTAAQIATAAVGPTPVGLVLVGGGHYLLVVNSNRFGDTGAPQTASLLRLGTGRDTVTPAGAYLTGGFPREIAVTADGTMAYVVDNGSFDLTAIDLGRLPA